MGIQISTNFKLVTNSLNGIILFKLSLRTAFVHWKISSTANIKSVMAPDALNSSYSPNQNTAALTAVHDQPTHQHGDASPPPRTSRGGGHHHARAPITGTGGPPLINNLRCRATSIHQHPAHSRWVHRASCPLRVGGPNSLLHPTQ